MTGSTIVSDLCIALPSGAEEPSSKPRLSALIVRVAAGDRLAFEEVYRTTASYVLAVVRRQLVDPSLSEEVRQEIYLEIWQTAGRYAPAKGSGITWISVIARRRAIDRVRAVQASRDRDQRAGIRNWTPPYDVVSEHHESTFEIRQAVEAMRFLTLLQREAIELVYREGLTSVEAGTRLGVTPGTVRTRVRDGIMRLRTALA